MIKKITTIVSVSSYLYKKITFLPCSMFESEHVLFSRMKIPSGDEEVLFQPPLRLFIAAKIMFNLMPLSAVQNMICFIYFNSCHCHHRVYYKLTMACSPVGLISSIKG